MVGAGNGAGQRVSSIIWLRYLFEFQYYFDHFLYLLFVRSAITRNSLFNLKRGELEWSYAISSANRKNDSPRLCNSHSGFGVFIEKKLFYHYFIRSSIFN